MNTLKRGLCVCLAVALLSALAVVPTQASTGPAVINAPFELDQDESPWITISSDYSVYNGRYYPRGESTLGFNDRTIIDMPGFKFEGSGSGYYNTNRDGFYVWYKTGGFNGIPVYNHSQGYENLYKINGPAYISWSTAYDTGCTTANVRINLIETYVGYTARYSTSGPTPPGQSSSFIHSDIKAGTTKSVATEPAAVGYVFSGWSTRDVTVSGGSYTMPADDVTFTGTWTPRPDTRYTVEFYKQDAPNSVDYSPQPADAITGRGTTGTQIRAALDMAAMDGKYARFHLTDASKADATTIAGAGTSVLKLYYDYSAATVSYLYSGTTPAKAPAEPAPTAHVITSAVSVAPAPTLPGYDFSGWSTADAFVTDGAFIMPATDVTFTGSWTARRDTLYTVEHYQQNIEDNAYTLANTEHCTGTTDTMAAVPEKIYPGFTMTADSAAAATGMNIDGDGTALLKLYYDRNINTVTYAYSGETDAPPPELPPEASYRYGQTVALAPAPTLSGYDFSGWESADVLITDGSFLMPDAPVVLTGTWSPRADTPYTVEYYHQNLAGDNYTLAETLNGEGVTGGNIPHREFEGFTMTPDSVTAEGNTKIKSDGTTLLKLYYDRERYTVSFTYAGAAPKDAPALPAAGVYPFGKQIALPSIPKVVSGMRFDGWTVNGVQITGDAVSVPAEDAQIIGGWSEIDRSGDDSDTKPAQPIPPQTMQTLGDNGSAYIIGYEDGTFRPDDYLTAKHETLMLSRLGLAVTPLESGTETLGGEQYITRREFLGALLDAAGAAVESDPVAQAAALGWLSGYADGQLQPDVYITRAQAVIIINRAFGRTATPGQEAEITYADLPTSHWAYDAVMAASVVM